MNAEEFKKKLDDMMLDLLPPNIKLVPNNSVEENKCYVIKDRELKRSILRNE